MYLNYYNMYDQDYDFYNRNSGLQQDSEEIITLNQAIDLIELSVDDEKEDEMFYNLLIEQAPTNEEKEIIKGIRNDERKHNQILRCLYNQFTGQILPESIASKETEIHIDYISNLKKALFGELNAVAKYRKILGTMPNGDSYTLLMSIMTDEMRHAIQYNFLICNRR